MHHRDGTIDRWDGLVWGTGLIALGVLFFLHQVHLFDWGIWRVWWPAVVLFLGLMKLLTARSPRRLGGAITMLGMGTWFLLVTNGLYGLTWYNSWPLALVAVGLGTLVRAIVSFFWRRDHDVEVRIDA